MAEEENERQGNIVWRLMVTSMDSLFSSCNWICYVVTEHLHRYTVVSGGSVI